MELEESLTGCACTSVSPEKCTSALVTQRVSNASSETVGGQGAQRCPRKQEKSGEGFVPAVNENDNSEALIHQGACDMEGSQSVVSRVHVLRAGRP